MSGIEDADPPLPGPPGEEAPSRAPQGRTVSEVLDAGIRLFRVAVLPCLPYAALAAAAGQIPAAYALARGRVPLALAAGDPLWWALYLAAAAVTLLMWGAVLGRERCLARAERPAATRELRAAARRLPAVVGFALPLAAALVLCAELARITGSAAPYLPLVYLAPGLAMSWIEVLTGPRGPLEATRAGFALVSGHWWRTMKILAASLVIVIVLYALGGLIGAFLGGVAALRGSVLLLVAALALPLASALLLATHSDLERRGSLP
jgi:hypothetical protein